MYEVYGIAIRGLKECQAVVSQPDRSLVSAT